MSNVSADQAEEIKDGLIQLRFSDDDGNIRDINAAELAEVLQGLVEFTGTMAKTGMLGHGVPPQVRVRPPKVGSFIVEAIVQWAGDNPEATIGLATTAGGAIVQGLNVGIKRLRGVEPSNFEYLENGQVKVQWPDNTVDEIPIDAWKKLNEMKRPTRRSLRKILAPLGDDVDRVEVRDGRADETTEEVLSSEPDVVARRDDYLTAATEIDEVNEHTDMLEVEGQLSSIDFRPGQKWRVQTPLGTRMATMEDESFLLEVDRGLALHKTDNFRLRIRQERVVTNGRTKIEWAVVRVTRTGLGGAADEQSAAASTDDDS